MDSNSNWTIKTAFFAIIFTIIAIPFWILYGPFCIIIKTIATIGQPYFYRKELKKWYKDNQEYIKKGIYVDEPPSYGTFLGVGPWFKKDLD